MTFSNTHYKQDDFMRTICLTLALLMNTHVIASDSTYLKLTNEQLLDISMNEGVGECKVEFGWNVYSLKISNYYHKDKIPDNVKTAEEYNKFRDKATSKTGIVDSLRKAIAKKLCWASQDEVIKYYSQY